MGAQSDTSGNLIKLGPYTERVAKVISERCKSISVRDEYTANLLSAHGIHNVIITGCPSNFINTDPTLGETLKKKANDMLESIGSWNQMRIHVSEHSWGHHYSSPALRATLELLAKSNSFYVLQTPELIPYLLKESLVIPKLLQDEAKELWGESNNIAAILRQTLLHFSSITSWMDFARTCDLAVGMRIHGNILPMQAGVPSMLVYHDSRTYGLGQTMGIPMVSPEEFVTLVNDHPHRMIEKILKGIDQFDEKRKYLSTQMTGHIVLNELKRK
jgi:polysaccharide pyruvyl transferase WcaK-like protein